MKMIADYKIGEVASLTKVFTERDVELFSNLSLDKNPVHLDEEYASKTIFKHRIVHGFLTSSLISAVIGTLLPGNGAIYLHQDLNFKAPVFINEEITAVVKVVDYKIEKNILYLQTICKNKLNQIVVEGTAIVKC